MHELKPCRGCGAEFPKTHPNRAYCTEDCRQRTKHRNRLARQTEDDLRKKREREARRLETKRDEINARNRERRKTDPDYAERLRVARRKSYQKHREVRIKNSVEWQRSNPDRVALRYAKRKARERGYRVTPRDLRRLQLRYGGACAYCGVHLTAQGRSLPTSLQWDHVISLARGGTHSVGNLVPACRTCNLSKGAKTVREWKRIDWEIERIEEEQA